MHAPAPPRALTVQPVRAKPNRCVVCGKGTNRQQKYCGPACKSPSSITPSCCPCGKRLPWQGESKPRKYCNKACYGKYNRLNITVEGVTKTKMEWAKFIGSSERTIDERLSRGWTMKQAVTIPATGTHRKVI